MVALIYLRGCRGTQVYGRRPAKPAKYFMTKSTAKQQTTDTKSISRRISPSFASRCAANKWVLSDWISREHRPAIHIQIVVQALRIGQVAAALIRAGRLPAPLSNGVPAGPSRPERGNLRVSWRPTNTSSPAVNPFQGGLRAQEPDSFASRLHLGEPQLFGTTNN